MIHRCGWCITDDHKQCQPFLTYYDKQWWCECECEKNRRTKYEQQAKAAAEIGMEAARAYGTGPKKRRVRRKPA